MQLVEVGLFRCIDNVINEGLIKRSIIEFLCYELDKVMHKGRLLSNEK